MPQEFTDANFKNQVLQNDKPVLVDFWAPWCGPCQMVAPVIEEVAQEVEGRAFVGKVNVDDNPHLAAQFGVSSIPTIMLFKGGSPVERIVGVRQKQDYIDAINNYTGEGSDKS
ncbi:thioredoxin [bacterium]|uniref:Thioredoxin n=1 Tax=candidate division WWE3 bacterium CG_4_9_14_3_um_filter_39_7 TaxID=1975080 RepID=A0A2M7X028_UNCKA|nr:thioredoxin [bacterium]PJA39167.1 MAG: thioredoxin [candidate division WWE3 bacterium CG_4_9_14_3_um_filter_39_7]